MTTTLESVRNQISKNLEAAKHIPTVLFNVINSPAVLTIAISAYVAKTLDPTLVLASAVALTTVQASAAEF